MSLSKYNLDNQCRVLVVNGQTLQYIVVNVALRTITIKKIPTFYKELIRWTFFDVLVIRANR